MTGTLTGRRIAILAADGVERVELEQPRQALQDADARTEIVSISGGEIQARDHDLADAGTFPVDRLVGEVAVEDYDALLTKRPSLVDDLLSGPAWDDDLADAVSRRAKTPSRTSAF